MPFLKRNFAALAVIAGLVLFFYFDFLLGRVFIWEDNLKNNYPFENYLLTSVSSGRIPLWAPGVENGIPFFSDPHVGFFYPLTWLQGLFVRHGELSFVVFQRLLVFHIMLGAIFMYFFLREHGLRKVACIAGAIAFCFSGAMALHVIHYPILRVYVWWPLQLLLVRRFVFTGQYRYVLGVILVTLLSLFAGFPAMTLYGCYLAIAYWIFCVVTKEESRWRGILLKRAGKEGLKICATFGAVILLGTCAILPAKEALSLTPRQDWGYVEIADQSLPLHYLLNQVIPNFFGTTPAPGTPPSSWHPTFWDEDKTGYWYGVMGSQPYLFWEYGHYAGQLWPVAALLLVFNRRRLDHSRDAVFFLGVALFALWFALGRHGGLFKMLYHTMPGISMFREPSRLLTVFNFASAVTIGLAVHSLVSKPGVKLRWPIVIPGVVLIGCSLGLLAFGSRLAPELKDAAVFGGSLRWTLFSLGALLGLAAVLFWLRSAKTDAVRYAASVALIAVLFADLYVAHGWFHRGRVRPDDFYRDAFSVLPQVRQSTAEHGPYRIAQLGGATGADPLFPRSFPFMHPEVEILHGYILWDNRNTKEFRAMTNLQAELDIQNASFLVLGPPLQPELQILPNTNALPRAQFYSRIRAYDSTATLLRDIETGKLDYHREAGVLAGDLRDLPFPVPPDGTSEGPGKVLLERTQPELYTLRYSSEVPGIIFVSESFFPGWEAVDRQGNAQRIVRTFGAFKGIVVPAAAEGEITVRYRPKSLRTGLIVSCTAAVLLACVAAWLYFKGRGTRLKAIL